MGKTLKLATWNVNSVRIRLEHIAQFTRDHDIDVLCLQETKVENDKFPHKAFAEMGFPHAAVNGQKSYHGVAILSRTPLTDISSRIWCDNNDSRHIQASLPGGIELHNFYVPAGGDIPDAEENDKFAHKLDFLREMATWFAEKKSDDNRFILVGDLNVAPLECDVWSHKQLLKVVSHTPLECELLMQVLASHDWIDAMRQTVPPPESLFTWWSYRNRDRHKANRGRRLDHIWVTPALEKLVGDTVAIDAPRDWERPSDHVPVVTVLNLP